jgi:hypothetical protein
MLNKMHINVVIYCIVVSFEYLHVWTPWRLQSSAETCSSNKRVCFCSYQMYLLTYFLLTYSLTHSMEQSSSWEANRFAASQEIPHILWNPKVHYRIYKYRPLVPILSQLDPVHTPTSHFLKIHLNIILSSMPGSSNWSLSLRVLHQNPVYFSIVPHMRYMPRPSNLSLFYHPNNIGWGVQIIKVLIV